jgi:maltose alpha-D-glucosyltransferase/alpha-amylase
MAASLIRRDPGKVQIKAWWQEVRGMFEADYPDAVLISEWGVPREAIAAGFHIDFMLHFGPPAYTSLFRAEDGAFFRREGLGDIRVFLDYYEPSLAQTGNGYISIPSGNHDMDRLADGRTPEEMGVAFAFLLTMPGVPFIYYGDEIGMRYRRGLRSKEGGYNRTGSRTPMQWTDAPNAGFSTAEADELYLPIDPADDRPTVQGQEGDGDSTLELVRRLVALRRSTPALQSEAAYETLYGHAGQYPLVYRRGEGPGQVIVAVNPADRAVEAEFDLETDGQTPELLEGTGTQIACTDGGLRVKLEPVSWGIFRL